MTTGERLRFIAAVLVASFSISVTTAAATGPLKVLYVLNALYTSDPSGTLILDAKGSLYGTTMGDCYFEPNCGVAYKLAITQGEWRATVLQNFGFEAGAAPSAGMLFDSVGNLYGTTYLGGDLSCGVNGFGCGTVFKLSPAAEGPWTETVLYSFEDEADGGYPFASLTLDSAGGLYGTTTEGVSGGGVVFELTPGANGEPWTETVLHTFENFGGLNPYGSLVFDSAGNLYGTTRNGGKNNVGVVFRLKPSPAGEWEETVLHSFAGNDGANPVAGLVFDGRGNLYGTTENGGSQTCGVEGCGVVFELTSVAGDSWREIVLHRFEGPDGANPVAAMTIDALGSLYGTTANGGSSESCDATGCGVVFKLTPTDGGWKEQGISFDGNDGALPQAGVALDSAGNLYGVAGSLLHNVGGVAYEIPAGNIVSSDDAGR